VGEYSIHSGQYEPDIRNVFVGNIGRLSSDGVQQLIKYFANLGVAVLKVDIKISFAFLEVRDTPDLQERIESIALGSGGHPPPFGRDGRLLRIEFVQQSSAGKQNIKMRRENMMQPTCSLFVVGFDHRRTSASTLASLFGKFGTVEHVEVKNNYAFVKFFNLNDSIAAQKAMHGFVWHDRTLSVEFSNRKSLGTLGMALLQHQQLHGLSGRPPIMPVHHLQERGGPAFNAPNAHHLPAPMHRSAPPHHSLQQQQASFAPSQHYSSSRPGLEHGNSGAPIAPVNSYDSSSMWTPAQGPTGVPATRPKVEFSAAPPPVNYLYSSGNPADARQRSIPAGSSSMNMPHGSRNAAVEHSFGTNFNNNFYSNAKADERAPKLYVMGGVQQRGYDSGATMAQPLHFQSRNAPSYQQARPADRNPSPRPEFNAGATYNTRAQIFDASPEDSLGSYTDHVYAEQGFRPAGGRTAGLPKHHQPYQFAHLEDHHQRNQPAFDVSGGASISSLGSNGSDGSRSHLSMPLQSGADVFTPGISTALNAPRQSFMPQSHQIPSSSYDIESDSQHYSSLNTAPLSLQEPFAGMMVASNRSNAGLSSHAVDMSQSSRPKGIYSSTNSASGGASSPGSSGPSPFVFSAQSFPVSPILSGENAEQKSFFYDVPVEAP
jgi:RNA recognition motif-containing protein